MPSLVQLGRQSSPFVEGGGPGEVNGVQGILQGIQIGERLRQNRVAEEAQRADAEAFAALLESRQAPQDDLDDRGVGIRHGRENELLQRMLPRMSSQGARALLEDVRRQRQQEVFERARADSLKGLSGLTRAAEENAWELDEQDLQEIQGLAELGAAASDLNDIERLEREKARVRRRINQRETQRQVRATIAQNADAKIAAMWQQYDQSGGDADMEALLLSRIEEATSLLNDYKADPSMRNAEFSRSFQRAMRREEPGLSHQEPSRPGSEDFAPGGFGDLGGFTVSPQGGLVPVNGSEPARNIQAFLAEIAGAQTDEEAEAIQAKYGFTDADLQSFLGE